MSEQIARVGKAVASDHLRSSSYGASANLARSRHSGATPERLPLPAPLARKNHPPGEVTRLRRAQSSRSLRASNATPD